MNSTSLHINHNDLFTLEMCRPLIYLHTNHVRQAKEVVGYSCHDEKFSVIAGHLCSQCHGKCSCDA